MDVVPAADVDGRQIDGAVMGGGVDQPPVGVVPALVFEDLVEPGRPVVPQRVPLDRPGPVHAVEEDLGRLPARPDRRGVQAHRGLAGGEEDVAQLVQLGVVDPPGRSHGGHHRRGPPDAQGEAEGPPGIERRNPVVGRAALRRHHLQVGRAGDRRQPLRVAHVRRSEHAHPTVGPGLDGRPLHGVVAVLDLAAHIAPLPFGPEPAPAVLEHHGEAGIGQGGRGARRFERPLAVGGPAHQDRHRLRGVRPPDVGTQADSVAHGDGHAPLFYHWPIHDVW